MPLKRKRLTTYQTQAQLFLYPYLVGMLLLTIIPALATLLIAFTQYNAIRPPVWVGLENFRQLLVSPLVRLSLRNSIFFLLLAVPLRLLAALSLALLLQPRRRLTSLYRTAVYLPTVIPEAAYALIWLWLFNPVYGPLNIILGWLHLPQPAWLLEPVTAQLAIVIMLSFQMGEGFVILLVGLQTIPHTLFQAATVDGATALQAFRHITLPLILPWILLLTFRDLIMSLQNSFTPSFILTYGGPYYATTYAPLLIYELAFDLFNLGLAAALLVLTYILIGLIIFGIFNLIGDKRGVDIV